MARSRSLNVVITGDASDLKRAFKQVDDDAGRMEGRLGRMGKVAGGAFAGLGVAAIGGAAVGLKKATEAAIEAEKSQARLETQLKASGISYKAHAQEIDQVIQKHSKLAGVDDEDLQDAFTNIVRSTGSVNTAMKDMGLVTDLARAKNLDVAKAGEILGKVHSGNTGILKRYGITVKEGASAQEALAELQQRFAGQAKTYGETTAGSLDRAKVALENLGETVGAKVAPLVADAADAFSSLVSGSGGVKKAYDNVARAVSRFADRHREEINDVIRAARRVGEALRVVFEEVLVPVIRRAVQIIGRIVGRIATNLRNLVAVVSAIINGDWKKAWQRFQRLVKDYVGGIVDTIKDVGGALFDAVKALGRLIVRGIVAGLKGLAGAVADALKSGISAGVDAAKGAVGAVIDKLPLGDVAQGFNDVAAAFPVGRGPLANVGGLSAAARAGLSTIQSTFGGVRLTSGFRDPATNARVGGATNSDHLTGNAIDLIPAGGWTSAGTALLDRVAAWAGRQPNVRWIGWRGVPGHGPGDHLHISFGGVGDVTGRIAVAGGGRVRGVGDVATAARAARAAGFRGSDLVTAVAIAGGESRWSNAATNLTYPDHSIGMWQINQLAHKGRFGTDAQLRDPVRNARAAYALYRGRGGGFQDWSVFLSGAYRSYLDDARRAIAGSRATRTSSAGASAGDSAPAASPSAAATAAAPVETVSAFDMGRARIEAAGADAAATKYKKDDIKAKRQMRALVGARIRKLRSELRKRGLRPVTRLRLTQELAQLKTEHTSLGGEIADLQQPGGASAGSSTATEAAPEAAPGPTLEDTVSANAAAVNDALSMIDLRERAGDITPEQAIAERAHVRNQALTGGFGQLSQRDWLQIMGDLRESAQQQTAAQEEAARVAEEEKQARDAHTEALNTLSAEMKRQTDFAASAIGTQSATAWRALADALSGQIVGRGLAARRATPGSGVEYAV